MTNNPSPPLKPMTEHPESAETITASDADDMSLQELLDLAQRTVSGYHAWDHWCEDHYDPTKAALEELLKEFGVITDSPSEFDGGSFEEVPDSDHFDDLDAIDRASDADLGFENDPQFDGDAR